MFFLKKKITFLFFLICLLVFFKSFVFAQTTDECQSMSGQQKVDCYQRKYDQTKNLANTLSSQISIMDSQINLTEARIEANKRQILDLTLDIDTAVKKISTLQDSLNKITEVLLNRIVATYEAGSVQPFEMLLSSINASDLLARLNYLRIAQAHDKRLIYDVQQAKNDYTNQKDIFEAKKKKVESLKNQLEAYTNQLAQEKQNKQVLLEETQGSEERYQQLLEDARREYEAIQGIVAGKGSEAEVGNVSEGAIIANVIQGRSCNSDGTHLHFMVTKDGVKNPFDYLRSVSSENCSGYSCGSSDGDPFNPFGDWNWPLDPTIKMNQGYGSTWAVKNTWVGKIYSFHNGIDIDGSSSGVKAVKSGKLYKGSYFVGCNLKYVKLTHAENGITTYYLHVNYIN